MASIRSYKSGAGGSSGADLAVLYPTLLSGNYYFVGNATAGASDANTGTERAKPLLTSAQAQTNSTVGDTVVYLSGHSEVIGTTVIWSKAGISLVGEGTGLTVPRFTCSGTIAMFDITGAGMVLDNLYFPASTAVPTARVRVASVGCELNALQFDCGASDTARALSLITGCATIRINNSRFTATAAGAATGLEVVNAVSDVSMNNDIFDGGSFGWTTYAMLGTSAVTRLRAKRIYQLNSSNMLLASNTTGTVNIAGSTGDSRVDWTP